MNFNQLFGEALDREFNLSEKKRRNTPSRPDYSSHTWSKMLHRDDARMLMQNSKESLLFIRRFRVPYQIFKEVIVPDCKANDVFDNNQDHFIVPIELKILIALRILGRDACADDCSENTGVSEQSCNRYFKQFVINYSYKCFSKYVYFPEVGSAELTSVMEVYRLLGFPGCLGSLDATHVKWDKCPSEHKWRCTGKEGEPTVVFQVVVSHSKQVFHVSEVIN